jgi:hypothetical protein
MYARVGIATQTKKQALVLPSSAVVDLGGRRGVFQLQNETAVFRTITVGSEQGMVVEVLAGLAEGDEVISTGAGALRDGDRVALAGGRAGGNGRGRRGDANASPGTDGAAPSTPGGPRAGAPAAEAQSGSRAGQGAQPGKDDSTAHEAYAGREGDSGRRGDGSAGRRSGGDGSGRRGGNGAAPPSGGVSQ